MTQLNTIQRAIEQWFDEWELILPPDARQAFRNTLRLAAEQPKHEAMIVSHDCIERGCMAHDDRVDGSGEVVSPVLFEPCRSPYCECDVGKCSHPGCYDARHEPFTHTPAAQRQPLTEMAIVDLMPNGIPAGYDGYLLSFARAIERAHKIGSDK